MNLGKSVRLFLADGTPGGLLTAEIMNWTGHVIAAPRSDLANLLKRPETSRTGVYVLLGDDPNSIGGQLAYIGEGDDVGKRIYNHARSEDQRGKDFWDRAIVMTSKDANLTKAHARYLESRFISLAAEAGRAQLTNATTPPPISLPEADQSDMEYFIAQAKIILPVLGVNIFRTSQLRKATSAPELVYGNDRTSSPIFELTIKKSHLVATAQELDGEFTVRKGSMARAQWIGNPEHNYINLHSKLIEDGVLSPRTGSNFMFFTRDYVFASPSAAAAVIAGRSANGRAEWVIQNSRQTYGEWEQEGIDEAMHGKS